MDIDNRAGNKSLRRPLSKKLDLKEKMVQLRN